MSQFKVTGPVTPDQARAAEKRKAAAADAEAAAKSWGEQEAARTAPPKDRKPAEKAKAGRAKKA